MKKSTIEKFFNFLDRKEHRSKESLDLAKVLTWKEDISVLEEYEHGIPAMVRQLLDPKQDPEKIKVKVEGDFDEEKITEFFVESGYVDGELDYLISKYDSIYSLEVTGDASFITSVHLPPFLTVRGDLDIRDSYVKKLPSYHLEVGGDFYVYNSPLWRNTYDMDENWLEEDIKRRGFTIGVEIVYTKTAFNRVRIQ